MKATALALSLLVLSACTSPTDSGPPQPEATPASTPRAVEPPPPWTAVFLDEAALIAADVRIEGPPGLREHLAIGQDSEHHDYTIRTIADGLLQETRVRSEFFGDFPVRCQLDNLTVIAERRVVVLERPHAVAVTVSASGNVYWRDATSGEERRGPSLVLRGDQPR